MYINDFESSSEYRLHQILHTLKGIHNFDLDIEKVSSDELVALGESSEVIKNSIISESQFNTYNQNPEYTKHMLILEAVRLYLTEIAPKRHPKRKIKEGAEQVAEAVIDKISMAKLGREMIDYSTRQRPHRNDEKEMRVLNLISQVGDKLTQLGEPWGPKGLDDMDKKVIAVAKRRMGKIDTAESQTSSDDTVLSEYVTDSNWGKYASQSDIAGMERQIKYDELKKKEAELTAARRQVQRTGYSAPSTSTTTTPSTNNTAPKSSISPASKVAPGTITVMKNNQTKTIPAAQLANMQKQGFVVVGDGQQMKEDSEMSANITPELQALMQQYGVEMDEGLGKAALELGKAAVTVPAKAAANVVGGTIAGVAQGVGQGAQSVVKGIGKGAVSAAKGIGRAAVELGKGSVAAAGDVARGVGTAAGDVAGGVGKGLKVAGQRTWQDIKQAGKDIGAAYTKEGAEGGVRSPQDCGMADAMQNLPPRPHKMMNGRSVTLDDPNEKAQYNDAYHNAMAKEEQYESAQSRINESWDPNAYQASMARSELYRNTKYAMDMLKIIKPEDEIQPWIASSLTRAADYLDKIFHYLDYTTKFEPQSLPEDMEGAPEEHQAALGETTGSMARKSLTEIIEYSTKLFNLIQPGDRLEGWVAMKLTTASDCVSSSKHYLDYVQFETHAADIVSDVQEMSERQEKLAKKPVKESVGTMLMQIMINEDQDLAQAQTLLAAKAMSDELQNIAEKVAKMSVEDLMPLVDTMKEQFGPEAAEGFNTVMKTTLEAVLAAATESKEKTDDSILQLQGGQIPGQASDIETAEPATGGEEAAPEEEPEDEFGGTAAAAGPAEEPLGRAKKAVAEAWDATMDTPEKDKGMWDGWTIAELKAEKKKLMDKQSRSAAEQKKVKQLTFAIRAKQKDKWGDIKEARMKLVSYGKKGDEVTAKDIAHHLAKRAGEYKGSDATRIEKLASEVAKHGNTTANELISKHRQLAKAAGMEHAPAHNMISGVASKLAQLKESAALSEKAPPGKKAEEFITKNKAAFKKRYGKDWERALYATAWKQFGEGTEKYEDAKTMLETTREQLAKLEKAFESHKLSYSTLVNEGKVEDPLNLGYGLDGEIMLEKMQGFKDMISRLKEMMKSELKSGAIQMIVAEQELRRLAKISNVKSATPFGVLWKDVEGNKHSKFFESADVRNLWVGMNEVNWNDKKIVNPEHFELEINKIKNKKG